MSPERVVAAHSAPRFLKIFVYFALLAGLVSLPIAVSTAFSQNHLQDQRNADRVATDLASCERGNLFRQQVIQIAAATKTLFAETLAVFIPNDAAATNPRVAAALARIDVLVAEYQSAVDTIKLTDCKQAVQTDSSPSTTAQYP